MDFIIVHGSPGNGKTTIAQELHRRLKSPWFEFGWIPEFTQKNPYSNISQKEEEQMSFENLVLVCKNYINHGFENVLLTDFDDIRMLDIPQVFKEYNYVIIQVVYKPSIIFHYTGFFHIKLCDSILPYV